MNITNTLLGHTKPFFKRFLLALFFLSMSALFTAVFAIIIQPIMDELFTLGGGQLQGRGIMIRNFILKLFGVQSDDLVYVLPLLLFLCFFGQAIFNFLSMFFMKTLGLKVVRNIRNLLFTKLVNHSVDFLSKAKTGDLVSRISNDIDRVQFAVSETLAVYVRETVTLVALLVVIFFQDWYMAMLSLIIFPFASFFLTFFARKVKKRGIQSQEAIGDLSGFLTEIIMGNRIVKAYNMEGYESERFGNLNQKHYHINSKIALIFSVTAPVMHTIGGVLAALIFMIGMKRVAGGFITPGQFTSFLAALFLMYNPIKRLSQANNEFQQGRAGFERVRQIFDSENPIKDRPDAMEVSEIRGDVRFVNVGFSYDQSVPVLKDIEFEVKAGENIALVGSSGSGKTTMMNLLLRFYDSDQGQILLDGMDIKDVRISSLRNAIGLVTQDVFLFNDTVKNNIAYGEQAYTMEEIVEAARIARADKFISKLAKGYDSIVGERGVFLSTGQRQRISIARAILKKPPILIFDEATSSLDSESENLIQEAMEEVMKNRTTFVIAHRLSTIVKADNILVIKKGEILESGSHQKLLSEKGLYYSLYHLQFPEMDIIM